MSATLRFWAAAREAAGTAEESVAAATLGAALAEAVERRGGAAGAELVRVLARCSVLVDGIQVGRADPGTVVLHEDSVVEILPPFAGG